MSKENITFIINPISGVGRQKTVEKLLEKFLDKNRFNYTISYTKAAKHATELAREAALQGSSIVVAVGGDGSVNEVATGLINSKTAMAIIPTGSGNGLARYLQFPLNLKKAILHLNVCSNTQYIDAGQLNQEYFFNVAGLGMDGHIAHAFANHGQRGFFSYIKLTLREFLKYHIPTIEIEIDGKRRNEKLFVASIANATQYGNNAHISPNSLATDGTMEWVGLKKVPWWQILPVVVRLFTRSLKPNNLLKIESFKELLLLSGPVHAHADGEPIHLNYPVKVKILPGVVRVLCR